MACNHFTVKTDHDSLKNLPNQPSVNRRVWKWVQILQGYDCDIVHIPGKDNPADFLSRRSIRDIHSMVDVRAQEESLVQRLRLGEDDQSDDAIQRKLDDVFKKSNLETSQTEGDEEGIHSLHSLFVTSTRITLYTSLKEQIEKGY